MDKRLADLTEWACQQCQRLNPHSGCEAPLAPVSGDASFRRYFRLNASRPDGRQDSWIAVDAPPDKEDNPRFVRIAQGLLAGGVSVPEIIAQDLTRGFLLLSDFGDTLLLGKLGSNDPDPFYQLAMDELLRLQQVQFTTALPDYDSELLEREMRLFDGWFLTQHLGLTLTAAQQAILTDAYAWIVQQTLAQPQVVVHRDYHCRNLMWREDSQDLGIIDFQDAVMGAFTYDLVSLFRDAYIAWPEAQVRQWVADFHARLLAQGKVADIGDTAQFWRWFTIMGAQRHLKVVGIFARLNYRDGKAGYLADIPRTLSYLMTELYELPELAALTELLDTWVLPAYRAKQGGDALPTKPADDCRPAGANDLLARGNAS